jgi:fructose-bisphosphate aldolase class II
MSVLLDHAAENDYGIAAFNIYNLEQVQAIMKAAHITDSPVIIQVYASAIQDIGEIFLRYLLLGAVETYPHLPIAINLDHGNSPNACYRAIKHGFSSVMMDGSLREDSRTLSDYEYNVDVTRQVVQFAHILGVTVEGALGFLGSLETGKSGKESGHGFEEQLSPEQILTDPVQAVDFVEQTQVDALAIAIGNNHGLHKFTRKSEGDILRTDRISEIHSRLPNTHLVLHGASVIPEHLIELINMYGGEIIGAYGVPLEETQACIKSGIRKINIDTDNRLAIMAAVRQALAKAPKQFDPRPFLDSAVQYMYEQCAERYEKFGSAGNASKIRHISLENYAAKYTQRSSIQLNSVRMPIAV